MRSKNYLRRLKSAIRKRQQAKITNTGSRRINSAIRGTVRPPHLLLDDKIYFVTVRCKDRMHFLHPDKYKKILKNVLNEVKLKFDIQIFGWVILNNHYHFLIGIAHGNQLPEIMKSLNGKSAYLINQAENVTGRRIWQNYFDKIIKNEKDFYTHLNYIHQNPIKHGLIPGLQALACYEFCSYRDYLKSKSQEWLNDCFTKYPVIDFIQGDEF